MHQEAARARELVGLLRDDPHRQLLAGQIGAGQFEGLGGLRLVDVHDRRLGLVTPRLQFLERILRETSVGLGAPWGVVIGSHPVHVPPPQDLAAELCTSVERILPKRFVPVLQHCVPAVIYVTFSSVPPAKRPQRRGPLECTSWSRKSREGTAFDKQGRPFRRRNYLPGILLFVALAVVTLMVWVIALNRPPDVREAAGMQRVRRRRPTRTPAGATLGEQVTRSDDDRRHPAKLADTKIRVLNASGQGGQAAEVAGELRDLGFAEPAAANDTVYVNTRLECQGQIRFGPAGRAAAAAVWLVAPCTELFQDQRSDATVDLAHRHRVHRTEPQ